MGTRDLYLTSVLLFSLLGSSCLTQQLAAPQARWVRVHTEHFRLHTDLSDERAREQALELERTLRAYLEHGWVHNGTFPLTLNVIMFADPYQLERYVGVDVLGYGARALPDDEACRGVRGLPRWPRARFVR